MRPPRTEIALAVACYLVHAADVTLRLHAPWDALWSCHVACLWIALGFARRSGALAGIGVCWLLFGNVLWLLDLGTGGELIPSSVLTHVGGLALGLRAVHRFGFPKGTWLRAVVAMLGLEALTRLTTPARANVNLAFAVFTGWEQTFSSFPRYFAFMFSVAAVSYLLGELLVRWALARLGQTAPAREPA